MSYQWIKLLVCGALLTGAGWPASSFAAKQDYDLADRIYEKYKEREQKDRGEQQKRTSGLQKNTLSNEREDHSEDHSEARAERQKTPPQDNRDNRDKRDGRYKRNTDESNSDRRDERTRSTERRSFDDQLRSNRSSTPAREESVAERVSLDQAVNMIRRRTDGKVVGAKTTGSGSRRQHRIKVLINDSRVRTYIVNASTGEIY